MKEHYVSYDCAVKLKELGFDWLTSHYYCAFDNETDVRFWDIHPEQSQNAFRAPKDKVIADAPRLDQAAAWLREVKGIIVWVSPEFYEGNVLEDVKWYFYAQPLQDLRKQLGGKFGYGYYSTYESALSAGIDAALELLTDKDDRK